MKVKETISKFDNYLYKNELSFRAVIIGGSALVILNIIDRDTRDVDCLIDEIPEDIKMASINFARKLQEDGINIIDDWFNNGPEDLVRDLPSGWKNRTIELYKGKALLFWTLCRIDLLMTKLFAMCDRQQDIDDCISLSPTLEELRTSYEWVKDRDTNQLWEEHVLNSFSDLARRLGYEFSN